MLMPGRWLAELIRTMSKVEVEEVHRRNLKCIVWFRLAAINSQHNLLLGPAQNLGNREFLKVAKIFINHQVRK